MIGIVGLGLVGGSLALDLHALGDEVVGMDPDPETRALAIAAGLEVADDLEAVAGRSDLVVVAAPPGAVGATLHELRVAHPDLVLTDVASVKSPAALGVDPAMLGPRWIGGHPMAGTERTGFRAARRGLLSGATWMLTPGDDVDPDAFVEVVSLVRRVGANPVVVAPDEHDRLVAAVSHVTHLLSFGLHGVAQGQGREVVDLVAGPSFRDATRVAASDPAFWAEVTDRNRAAVTTVMRSMRDWLEAALGEDTEALTQRLRDARRVPAPPSTATAEVVLGEDGAVARLRDLGGQGLVITDVEAAVGGARLALGRR